MKVILLTITLAVSLISASANSAVDYGRQEILDVSLQQDAGLETTDNDIQQNTGSRRRLSNIENRKSIINNKSNPSGFKEISNESKNKAGFDIAGYGAKGSYGSQYPRSVFYKSRNNSKNTPVIHINIISRENKYEQPDAIPEYKLGNNFPNPFNPDTTIGFSLPQSGKVNLSIFNIKGQLVRTLVDEKLPEGEHSIVWDGRDNGGRKAGSGVYFYRLTAGENVETKRMLLLK